MLSLLNLSQCAHHDITIQILDFLLIENIKKYIVNEISIGRKNELIYSAPLNGLIYPVLVKKSDPANLINPKKN